ncbi:hypothetical protein D3C86_905080 [compost metagenome]
MKSAPAVKARKIRAEIISDAARSRAKGRIMAGLMAARFSSSRVCGFSTHQQTAPMATSLRKVLMNWTMPSGPKMRLNPDRGLTADHLGLIFSAVNRKPDWARLPPTPPTMTASIRAARNGVTAQTARMPISTPAPACKPPIMAWGSARKGSMSSAIWREK